MIQLKEQGQIQAQSYNDNTVCIHWYILITGTLLVYWYIPSNVD